MRTLWGLLVVAAFAAAGMAQSGNVNYYSAFQLQQMAHKLEQQETLRSAGTGSKTLDNYTSDYTMLMVRTSSGGAEVHEHYADIFFVLDGEATLRTGGKVLNPASAGPGETRGTAVQGGAQQRLAKGDVVHISPKTPHQLLISSGHSLSYFVVKVKE